MVGLVVGLAALIAATVYVRPPDPAPAPVPVAAVEQDPVRDTEAEALVAARNLQQPVEVLSQRSEYRDVFAQPDGTLIANDHTQPVRVTQGDRWVPADPTLVAGSDGTLAPTAALLGMRLSAGGTSQAPLMVVTRDEKTMTLTWPFGTLPPATIIGNGDQAKYENVLKDVDLIANVTVEGFSHVLVLKTPEAAQLPELQNLRLGVTGVGLTIQETEGGGVVALDPATGNPVLEADAPHHVGQRLRAGRGGCGRPRRRREGGLGPGLHSGGRARTGRPLRGGARRAGLREGHADADPGSGRARRPGHRVPAVHRPGLAEQHEQRLGDGRQRISERGVLEVRRQAARADRSLPRGVQQLQGQAAAVPDVHPVRGQDDPERRVPGDHAARLELHRPRRVAVHDAGHREDQLGDQLEQPTGRQRLE
nr:hypothetical protein GCM10020092_036810 [Actinoplanes digitatis]